MSLPADHEVLGVQLGDVYRDKDGALWEVYALCTEPTASVRQVGIGSVRVETHVIGSRNWEDKWKTGPLREAM